MNTELDETAFRAALDAVQAAFEAGEEHEGQTRAAILAYNGAIRDQFSANLRHVQSVIEEDRSRK